jgi:hypothetical protein
LSSTATSDGISVDPDSAGIARATPSSPTYATTVFDVPRSIPRTDEALTARRVRRE